MLCLYTLENEDDEWNAVKLGKALDSARDIIQAPLFRRCFLVQGSFGAGKTHFIASLLCDSDESGVNQHCLLLPLVPPKQPQAMAELILQRVTQATKTRCNTLQDLDEFMDMLDSETRRQQPYLPKKLVIVLDGLETWLEKDTDFLAELETFITENSGRRYLFWLITLHDNAYGTITGSGEFFNRYGWLRTPADVDIRKTFQYRNIHGWIDLDHMNREKKTGLKILREHEAVDAWFIDLVLGSFDSSKQLFKLVNHPFIAWIIIELCDKKNLRRLINFKYFEFVKLYYTHQLDRLRANKDTRVQITKAVEFIADIVAQRGEFAFNYTALVADIVEASQRQSDLKDEEKTRVSLAVMDKMNLLKISKENTPLPMTPESGKKIEIASIFFWECHLASGLFNENRDHFDNNALDEIKTYLGTWFEIVSRPQVKAGVLEFFLMACDTQYRKTHPHIPPKLWDISIHDPLFPPDAAWSAAAKSSAHIQETLLNWTFDNSYSPQDHRTLFAYMHFISEADIETFPIEKRFRLLQFNFNRISEARFQHYYLYIVDNLLDTVEDNEVLLKCMYKMHGSEKLGLAQALAYLTVPRLFSNMEDSEEAVDIILQYLSKLWKNASSYRVETPNEKKWIRHYYREWVLYKFMSELLNKYDPEATFDLLDKKNWYTPDRIGINKTTVPREMEREASIAFGFWYRRHSSYSFVYDDGYDEGDEDSAGTAGNEYLQLVERLESSGKGYMQRAAFFLIYHTVPTDDNQEVKVEETFHPMLKKLVSKKSLMWVKNKFSKFLSLNNILEEPDGQTHKSRGRSRRW